MDTMDNHSSIQEVCGYQFGSREDVKRALSEQQKIEYFREKTVGKSTKVLYAFYHQLLEENMFQTPVGFEYLKELQNRLYSEGVPREEVKPIPLTQTYSRRSVEELKRLANVQMREVPKQKKLNVNALQISVIINVLLVILVLAMFVITLQSEHPNVLNYRKAVIDEYSSWEQEITERENAVREKERELNLLDQELEGNEQ